MTRWCIVDHGADRLPRFQLWRHQWFFWRYVVSGTDEDVLLLLVPWRSWVVRCAAGRGDDP